MEYVFPKINQKVVKIVETKENHVHEVISPQDEVFLVTMPMHFRRMCVKRGHYLLVNIISEGDSVKAEIEKILTNEIIKFYKQNSVWPLEFDNSKRIIDIPEIFMRNRVNFNTSEDDTVVNPEKLIITSLQDTARENRNKTKVTAYGDSDTSSCSSDSDYGFDD